ncbi:hypothetical protein [Mariniluteicoccus flavus]
MRRSLGALVAAFVAALVALLAMPVPSSVACESTVPGNFACDGSHHIAVPIHASSERGPPATSDPSTTYNADGELPLGASARPDWPTTPTAYGYDDLTRLLHTTGGDRVAQEQARRQEASSVVVQRSDVAANSAAPRFIGNSAGDILDTTRVTIPEGKFGYLLKNPSKSGVFKDSMGFDQAGLDSALRSHLTTNFGNASASVPMTGGGTKFVVRGPLTGPSGQTWNITSAWGVDVDGTIRLITATP